MSVPPVLLRSTVYTTYFFEVGIKFWSSKILWFLSFSDIISISIFYFLINFNKEKKKIPTVMVNVKSSEIGDSGSGSGSLASIAPFLRKCYEMVDNESTDSIISWNETNDSFVISDMTQFSVVLLPKYFKHSNFSSFMRQLNIYVSFFFFSSFYFYFYFFATFDLLGYLVFRLNFFFFDSFIHLCGNCLFGFYIVFFICFCIIDAQINACLSNLVSFAIVNKGKYLKV